MQAMTVPSPRFAAIRRKVRVTMDVILHLGAHRTASTSFQHYMRENAAKLMPEGIGFWGPLRTRDGLLSGIIPVPGRRTAADQLGRAKGRIALHLKTARDKGIRQLIVSDENMIGAARKNLRDSCLYAGVGERMARYNDAFAGKIVRVALSIRSQDGFWASSAAFAVGRGHVVPRKDDLDRLVTTNRHWREVVADLYCALPGAEIQVMPYEIYGGLPERKLAQMTGLANPPRKHAREWLNRAPDLTRLRQIVTDRGGDAGRLPEGTGRWHPFDRHQTIALREAYADDLFWLRAGADGCATLIEETGPEKAGQNPSTGQNTTRGQPNGIEERRLA
ncbi:hypothetical protein PEL8287_03551 [Roseovarius litorisediminis]|uniref:Uncharacterized protein n=1 Tax=Roseovarius litorisediminis TaxID=1312363 RepID=A0A1Y5TND6_9RHOB|nr:hypothetical protein [Roseovarius litorisediminis]SLN64460.1 hypothetical protein PEL8287_03551 [Roseovarius litorisediminis]